MSARKNAAPKSASALAISSPAFPLPQREAFFSRASGGFTLRIRKGPHAKSPKPRREGESPFLPPLRPCAFE
jgi:hypothetical protein